LVKQGQLGTNQVNSKTSILWSLCWK